MSVAPNVGIVEFGVFRAPDAGLDGVQGQVPGPTSAEAGYVLSTTGWVPGGGGGGSGTVTSVGVSGGTTGLTFSGGPVTSSGTITMSGTLDLDNGGTGATTAANARTNLDAQKTITSGTASPSGGVDGDIYLQYV
jgi:hypothetical protein